MNEPTYHLRLGVLGLAIFVSMLGVGMVVPFLPIYASEMGATGVMLGVIFSAFSAARSLLMPYVGILSDRYGRKPFIVLGLGGSAAVALP
jgi:MFS family permease